MDILQLQNLCRRDPQGYKEDFLLQKGHFDSQLKIYLLKPSKNFEEFEKQIKFLSHVAPYYKEDMKEFPLQLAKLLEEKCDLMESRLRRGIVGSLILLRNRGLYKAVDLLSLCFKLFKVHDKLLREMLYSHIVSDIKRVNKKNKSNSLNNTLQSFMFGVMTNADSSLIAAKKSLDIMIELYRKKIWNDAKTVNAISLGLFSKNTKIVTATLKFFLNATSKTTADGSDDEEDNEEEQKEHKERQEQIKELRKKLKSGSKKSKGKTKKMQQTLDRLRKQDKTDNNARIQYNFPAIDLLYDAQSFCEKVFNVLKKTTERFEVRLMMMNFVSRLIGHHKLFVENFYPFVINYMHPKQEHITYILAVLCQACHDLVAPDTLEPVIRVLSMNFVSDRCSPEVMALGINSIREICTRCPLAMTPELLQDLAMYKNTKDKGVIMAARSLINFFRQTNPQLLHRRDRGKGTDVNVRPLGYGESKLATGLEGIELLEEYERQQQEEGMEQEEGWEGWELASNDSDAPDVNDDAGWVEVDSDEEMDEDDDENANDDNNEEEAVDNVEEEEDNEDEEEEQVDDEEEDETSSTITTTTTTPTESLRDRILTQEDLDKIRAFKERKQLEAATGLNSKKRKQPERVVNPSEDISEIVDPADLEGFSKHVRKTKEERMASIMAGREGRHFGSKRGQRDDKPTTNKEKLSSKPFMLVRYSKEIQKKKNMTTREKQKAKRKHTLHQKSQVKYKH